MTDFPFCCFSAFDRSSRQHLARRGIRAFRRTTKQKPAWRVVPFLSSFRCDFPFKLWGDITGISRETAAVSRETVGVSPCLLPFQEKPEQFLQTSRGFLVKKREFLQKRRGFSLYCVSFRLYCYGFSLYSSGNTLYCRYIT